MRNAFIPNFQAQIANDIETGLRPLREAMQIFEAEYERTQEINPLVEKLFKYIDEAYYEFVAVKRQLV